MGKADERHDSTSNGETTMRCNLAEKKLINLLRQVSLDVCDCDIAHHVVTVRFAKPVYGHSIENLARAFLER